MYPVGPSSNITPPPSLQSELLNRLRVEHGLLGRNFDYYGMTDSVTTHLSIWNDAFGEALESGNDPETVLREFIPLLQNALHDDMPGLFFPLDDLCYICNDGRAVGDKALSVYLHFLAEEYQGRSPFHPEDETPLTVRPHPIAQAFIAWLKAHGRNTLPNAHLEVLYSGLETLPAIPVESRPTPPPRTRTFAERVERLRREARESEARAAVPELSPETEVEDPLGPIIGEVEAANRREEARTLEQERAAEELRQRLEVLGQNRLNQIQEIREQNRQLTVELQSIRDSADTTRRSTIELQQSVSKVSQAEAERQASASRGLTAALCTLVVVIIIKIYIPAAPVVPIIP